MVGRAAAERWQGYGLSPKSWNFPNLNAETDRTGRVRMPITSVGPIHSSPYGVVSERLKEPVSKTGVRFFRTVGSNPTRSACPASFT